MIDRNPSEEKITAAISRVEKLFPLKNEEDLKIYAILSVHHAIAHLITDDKATLVIVGAYSLDTALQANSAYLASKLGLSLSEWRFGLLTASLDYVAAVPVIKMASFIEKIEKQQAAREKFDPVAKAIQELESYMARTFLGFYADMGSTYQPGLTLDRIDGKKGYSKANCRWATPREQNNNRSTSRLFSFNGQTLSLVSWASITGIGRSTLAQRIYVLKWPIEAALSLKC